MCACARTILRTDNVRSIRGRSDFQRKLGQTKTQNHETTKVCSINILIRNAKKGFKELQSRVVERLGLVCFLKQRDFDDPGIDDLMNGERFQISGTRRDGSTT